jgi:hypothetical protein
MQKSVNLVKKEILEFNKSGMKPLVESSIAGSGPKRLKLEGTAIVCDVEGINGRVYPTSVMAREAKKLTENFIKYGDLLGELNHPPVDEEGNSRKLPVTELDYTKVCHIIESLHMVGNELRIKSRVIEKHPCGAIIKTLVEEGVPVGVSLRGLGSVYRHNGQNMVSDDYELITVDIVGRPSYGRDAMLHPIMESINSGKIPVINDIVDGAVKEFKREIDSIYSNPKTAKLTKTYSVAKLMEALKNA